MSASPSWNDVRALFDQLLETAPPGRVALLVGADPALAREASALLRQHEDEEHAGGHFLSRLPTLEPDAPRAPEDWTGRLLGNWTLVSRIGTGGMGEVWLAERADGQFQGRAAVKLLRLQSADSGTVRMRFAQERQALARLNHPHIAHLLDAGTTDAGQPYVVMEYVEGRPLDEASRGLGLEQRLALFLQLAEAVAHAHRKLLLHRDLKPGNVLVTAERQVKLLDFGIAKVLDPLAWGDGGGTVAGERPFTPHYASPEQIRGEPLGPASDIYSLGVLLYELLTGVRPVGRGAHTSAQAVKAVLEEVPCAPSQLSAAQAAAPDWRVLRRRLAGDLDHIVLKALDPDPDRRHASVPELAADLHAHLEGLPVPTRRTSTRDRLARWGRRHRVATVAAGIGALGLTSGVAAALLQGHALAALGIAALATGLGLALWQGQRADRALRRAERHVRALNRLAGRVIFDYHDGIRHLEGSMPVRRSMLGDALTYLRDIEDTAEHDPRIAYDLARMAHRLALLEGATFNEGLEQRDRADASFARALRLVELACPPDMNDAAILLECASIVADAAEFDQRMGRLQPGTSVAVQGAGRDALSGLGRARDLTARARAADPAHPNLDELLGTFEGRLGRLLGHSVDVNLGRWSEARRHLEVSADHMRRFCASRHHDAEGLRQLTWALLGLAAWHRLAGEPPTALALAEEAFQAIRTAEAAAPGHKVFAQIATMTLTHRSAALALVGRVDEALACTREAMERQRRALQADPGNAMGERDLALMKVSLGRVLVEGGRPVEAQEPLTEADEALRDLPGREADAFLSRWYAEAGILLARALVDGGGDAGRAGRRVAAEIARLPNLASLGGSPQVLQTLLAQAESVAGDAQARLGDADAARAHRLQALRHWAAADISGQSLPRSLAQRRRSVEQQLGAG